MSDQSEFLKEKIEQLITDKDGLKLALGVAIEGLKDHLKTISDKDKQIQLYREGNLSEVRHPINSDGKINTSRSYCYGCGKTVKNQLFCHGCGKKLQWDKVMEGSIKSLNYHNSVSPTKTPDTDKEDTPKTLSKLANEYIDRNPLNGLKETKMRNVDISALQAGREKELLRIKQKTETPDTDKDTGITKEMVDNAKEFNEKFPASDELKHKE